MTLAVKRSTPLRDMLKMRYFRVVSVLSVLAWMGTLTLILVRVLPIIYGKTAAPLHYNIHVGVDTVGPWWRAFLVPAVGLLVMLVNIGVARYMWSRDPVLSHMLALATVMIELILLTATFFIVYLTLQYA
jgi:hypothetical protein